MEKLTSVLACTDRPEEAWNVLAKASEIAACFGARVELLEHGDILRHAARSKPDLIVKAPSGRHALRRLPFTTSDWKLVDECAAPVMLVRDRPWGSPLRFAAAVDVSDEDHAHVARSIVHTAGFLAAGVSAELEILYSEREPHEERVRMQRMVKLAQLVREFHVGCEHIRRVEGAPEETLPTLAAERRHDVIVLGGESRRLGWSRFLPGTASRTLDAFAGDVVLVRAPARRDERGIAALSGREQPAYQGQ